MVGFVWAVLALAVSTDDLTQPLVAVALLAAAGVITAASIPRAVGGRRPLSDGVAREVHDGVPNPPSGGG